MATEIADDTGRLNLLAKIFTVLLCMGIGVMVPIAIIAGSKLMVLLANGELLNTNVLILGGALGALGGIGICRQK